MELIDEIRSKYVLHWNFRGYDSLPEELKIYGHHIEEIYLKWNNIVSLPPWVKDLKLLTSLYMFANNLETLPDEIGLIPNLRVLDLNSNHISKLPDTLCKLRNLIILNVRYNKLRQVPRDIGNLKCLSVLNLQGNLLSKLPESICYLVSLSELFLDFNYLTSLPQNIVYLPNLTMLSVKLNCLIFLPFIWFISNPMVEICHNPSLNYLSYDFGFGLTMKGHFDIIGGLWNVLFIGCCKELTDEFTAVVEKKIYVPMAKRYILLPPSLTNVVKEGSCLLPSLYELCLRVVYRCLFTVDEIRVCHSTASLESLPPQVESVLRQGPTALCQNCRGPLFTNAILWLIQRFNLMELENRGINYIIAGLFLCSNKCSKEFAKEEMERHDMDNLYMQTIGWEWK